MKIEKRNSEGYADPTAFEAMTKIAKEEKAKIPEFRSLVYICSPYTGDIENNVKVAQRYSRFAVRKGYIPIAPHLLFPQFLNDADPVERKLGLLFGNILMSKCSEIWVCGNRVSTGMEAEISRALKKRYKIRYFNENGEEVSGNENLSSRIW